MIYIFLGLISLVLSCFFKGIDKQSKFIIFVIIYDFIELVSYFYNFNADIQEMLWLCAYMNMGLLLLNFHLDYKYIKFLYYFIFLFFIFMIVNYQGVNNLCIYTAGSRNTISEIELLFITLYGIQCNNNKKSYKYRLSY